MTQLEPSALTELQRLIDDLDKRTPLSKSRRSELYEHYSRRTLQRMLDSGVTYGEATGAPGVALSTQNENEFKSHLRAIDNDLEEHVRIVREGIDHHFNHGEVPPPYYAWRIAVILRKYKQYDLEADFLESFSKHFGSGLGGRYTAIADRAPKARRLADKSRD